jgi:hypothetical protein
MCDGHCFVSGTSDAHDWVGDMATEELLNKGLGASTRAGTQGANGIPGTKRCARACHRAQHRLHRLFDGMRTGSKRRQVMVVVVAREFACCLWARGQRVVIITTISHRSLIRRTRWPNSSGRISPAA